MSKDAEWEWKRIEVIQGNKVYSSQYTHHHRICIVFIHSDTYMRYSVFVIIYYIKYFML